MPHIHSITRHHADPAPGLPNGGTRWTLTCAPLPTWIRSLPTTNEVRKSLMWDFCRELRNIPGIHQVQTDERWMPFVVIFSTESLPGLPAHLHQAIEQALERCLYNKTEPITGQGNDI